MNILQMGGWMMWPLLFVSLAATAIIIEKILLFLSFSFPGKNFSQALEQGIAGNMQPLLKETSRVQELKQFTELLCHSEKLSDRETALRIAGESVLKKLERHLPALSMLARLAPLMGLLGTVLGMISAFSEIASAQAGVNMNQLAGGIWQALITTAAGLFIAIPSLFFLHCFQRRVDAAASALSETVNIILAQPGTN